MTRHCANPECPGLARDGASPEFLDEVATCIDCGSTLMLGPAPEDPHEGPRFTDFETVFIASDSVQAHLVRGLLESEGLLVYLKGESLTSALGELPVHFKQVDVQVPPEHKDRARALVMRFENPAE